MIQESFHKSLDLVNQYLADEKLNELMTIKQVHGHGWIFKFRELVMERIMKNKNKLQEYNSCGHLL